MLVFSMTYDTECYNGVFCIEPDDYKTICDEIATLNSTVAQAHRRRQAFQDDRKRNEDESREEVMRATHGTSVTRRGRPVKPPTKY